MRLPELLGLGVAGRLEDDVRCPGQAQQFSLPGLGGQVEQHAGLIRVAQPEDGRVPPPGRAAGRLDQDHLRAEVGQVAPAVLGVPLGEVEHPQADQWQLHRMNA